MKKTYSKNSRQGLPGGPNEMFEKVKNIIVSQRGQWDFPGMNTMVPTDDGRITMRGVPYPVYGQDETGYGQMMYPNQEYQFPGKNVLELPMAQVGLQVPIQQPDALRVHMNINPNAEYMEKKKSDVLDLDNTLDYLVETRGGTRDLWGHMADTIGYHESGHTMDPLQMQNSGGPGRGIFQFEAPSLITAQNRYQRISDRLNLKPDPKILSAKSALELSPEQQYSLFLINLSESSAKLKDYADNKLPLVDLWLQGHKKIEKGENRGSFRTSVQKAKDKSIQKGYDSFKQLGGALPRFQYEGQFNPQLARPNPLTGKYAWEQSIPKNKQLKSATGNVGFFDMTNPNIYKALAPVMGIGAGAYGVNQMQDAQPMQRFGGNLNFQKGGDYNMKRASELGYTPDEAGHYPSVDEETGMWLKSKQHPTAWMESMYGYQLNPEVYNNYNVTYNPEGYFGENQLQYMSKQFGGSLPTAGDPVLNFIQRQSPRFSKSKK